MKSILIEEAYRAIKVRDGSREVTIPMIRAVVRSMALAAVKGQARSQRMFTALLQATEKERKTGIEAMSGRLGMNKCRLTSLIRLSYLAPDIVRALLEGRQPIELTPTRLLRLSKDLPHDWSEQRHVLGFAA